MSKRVFNDIRLENICYSKLPIKRPYPVKVLEEDGWIVSLVVLNGRYYLLDVRQAPDEQ